MQKQYNAPELTLAGEADQVVFGGGGGGFDYDSEIVIDGGPHMDDPAAEGTTR